MTPSPETSDDWAAGRIVFSGEVDDKGKVHPDETNITRGRLARWSGRRVSVTVEKFKKPRTMSQLGYYFVEHGVLDCWAEWMGDTRAGTHKTLKVEFLAPQLVMSRLSGTVREIIPSLADLSDEEMSAFLETIIREGNQRGIEFPPTRPKSSSRVAGVGRPVKRA